MSQEGELPPAGRNVRNLYLLLSADEVFSFDTDHSSHWSLIYLHAGLCMREECERQRVRSCMHSHIAREHRVFKNRKRGQKAATGRPVM